MTPTPFHISRRRFLQRGAAAAAAAASPWFVERELSAAESSRRPPGPNDRPGIALSAAAHGTRRRPERLALRHIVAVCDVDAACRGGGETVHQDGKVPAKFSDLRK